MSSLASLLDVQQLDVTADALLDRRLNLPARSEREDALRQAADLDLALAAIEQQREALRASERATAGEVAGMAARAKEAEDKLYSGSVKATKELQGLQEEVRLLKQKQSELEETELELMEQIEASDDAIRENREARAACDARVGELDAQIAAAEGEIDGELMQIGASRADAATGVPTPVLERYGELRSNPRLAGRPAARLEDGACRGCRMTLSVMDHHRIQAEPPDAIVRCTHCHRLLVR